MRRLQGIVRRAVSWILLAVILGCGTSHRAAVVGKVSLDGKPVDDGIITFIPSGDNRGSPAWGKIQAGDYAIPAKTGPSVGTNRVEIRWARKTGRMVPIDPTIEETVEAVPVRYNSQSVLQVEIKPGTNQFDFNLNSDSARKP